MLKIGRAGLDVSLDNPEAFDHDGDMVTVKGELYAANIYDAKALRQQILGLANNPDEPIVPVIWDEDPFVDGYYQILSAQVPTVPGSLNAFWFPFSVGLRRIPNYAQPVTESVLVGPDYRVNSHSYTSSGLWHAVPATAVGYRRNLPMGFSGPAILASEDGNIAWHGFGGSGGQFGSVSYWIPPADWYDGSPRFRIAYGGGTARYVVGRQHINEPRSGFWDLTNGILKVVMSHASNFELGISRWTGSAYSTVKKFQIGSWDGASSINVFPAPGTLNLIRNDPAAVVIRFTFDPEASNFWGMADLTLRRGAPFIELTMMTSGSEGNALRTWGVGRTTTEAASSLSAIVTGMDLIGIKATSNDGDGLKYVIGTPGTNSRDLTDGEVWLTSNAKRTTYLIGLAREADDALIDDPEELAASFMNPRSETIRFVEQ